MAAIARRCRLSDADVAEVCQTTWLRLVENLDRIEQPERLGAWLATTSRRESLRIATRTRHGFGDATRCTSWPTTRPIRSMPPCLRDEQARAIRMAAERLSPRCQRLLGVLMGDDELPYKTIAEQLSMPIGSIGPTRGGASNISDSLWLELDLSQVRDIRPRQTDPRASCRALRGARSGQHRE